MHGRVLKIMRILCAQACSWLDEIALAKFIHMPFDSRQTKRHHSGAKTNDVYVMRTEVNCIYFRHLVRPFPQDRFRPSANVQQLSCKKRGLDWFVDTKPQESADTSRFCVSTEVRSDVECRFHIHYLRISLVQLRKTDLSAVLYRCRS